MVCNYHPALCAYQIQSKRIKNPVSLIEKVWRKGKERGSMQRQSQATELAFTLSHEHLGEEKLVLEQSKAAEKGLCISAVGVWIKVT